MFQIKFSAVSVSVTFGLAFLFLAASCEKEPKISAEKPPFERKEMLENIGNNLIIPNYNKLSTELQALKQATDNFTSSPDAARLEKCRATFLDVYKIWQHCSAFEIGPAEQKLLRANVNTFPADTVKINNNIDSGIYNLATASNITAKGFPAIDFLLFHPLSTSEIIALYTTSEHAERRKEYLKAITDEIADLVASVHNQWLPSAGNYIGIFTNSLGNDAGSAIGMLVNQLNYDYEILKTNKVAIPFGKKSLGILHPEKVEAYYSGKSLDLMKEHVIAIENIYLGNTGSDENKIGLEDYLIYLGTKHNDQSLDEAIKNQFKQIKTSMALVPDPFSEAITNDASTVNSAYIEIQKMVVLLKTDLPSALGVLITYQDNDGD